jgi:hypothetical protein
MTVVKDARRRRHPMQKTLRSVGVLALMSAGYVALPSNSGAHCVPGWIHMSGVIWNADGVVTDSGCTNVGTSEQVYGQPPGCYCGYWGCQCYYDCDGC